MTRDLDRYSVLDECLIMFEAESRRFSRNHANQVAQEGYEQAFASARKKAEVIRDLMREARYGPLPPAPQLTEKEALEVLTDSGWLLRHDNALRDFLQSVYCKQNLPLREWQREIMDGDNYA